MKQIEKFIRSGSFSFIALILSAIIFIRIQELRPVTPLRETITFSFNEGFPSFTPDTIRAISFGYAFAFASYLWTRFLIHTPPVKMGQNEVSWIYLDLNAISIIDPSFIPVFTHGASYLSIITEDKKGGRLLLERGVQLFPNFWRIRAFLAYHYQYELGENRLAAEQYDIASRLPGAPPFFSALAATLYEKSGEKELAIKFLRSMMDNVADEGIRKRLQQKLTAFEGGGT
jgi:hypothetical protein